MVSIKNLMIKTKNMGLTKENICCQCHVMMNQFLTVFLSLYTNFKWSKIKTFYCKKGPLLSTKAKQILCYYITDFSLYLFTHSLSHRCLVLHISIGAMENKCDFSILPFV